MQTIKVNVKREKNEENLFLIDGKVIATIAPDPMHIGRYVGSFENHAGCNNERLSEAVEFISGCIEKHFAEFNLSVEFDY